MTPDRSELLGELRELGQECPGMRFGQLCCWVASQPGNEGLNICQIKDPLFLTLARGCRGAFGESALAGVDSPTRETVLKTVSEYSDTYPDWELGLLLVNLAAWAGVQQPWLVLYHVTDDELIVGGKTPKSERTAILSQRDVGDGPPGPGFTVEPPL